MTRAFKTPVEAPAVSVNGTAVSLDGHTHTDLVPKTLADAKGEIPVGNGTTTSSLTLGTDGYVLTADSTAGVGIKWAAAPGAGSGISESLIAAKGDLIVGSANDVAAILTVGTNDYVLTADSTATNGVAWKAASGGGSTSVATLVKWGND